MTRNALQRLIGIVRSPRATLSSAVRSPRSIDLAILIIAISATCSAAFLMTRVGQLAALDQQVRQLESFGVIIDDARYAELRRWVPYRPAISVAIIAIGWPILWTALAAIVRAFGNRITGRQATYAQVLTVVVHASALFAVRAVVAAPINYVRESIGGATSLSMLMPAFGESTFPARLLGMVDIFLLWWVALMGMGLGMLYDTRPVLVARWLLGAYTAGAVVLALTQALRGGL
jgi:hypothetical protein